MQMYCLCQSLGIHTKHNGQVYGAPNRWSPGTDEDRPVLLQSPMPVIQMGVEQRIMNSSDGRVPRQEWLDAEGQATEDQMLLKETRKHSPNVDILKCSHCGVIVVRDG